MKNRFKIITMTDLQKQFESTGYASWINSEIYHDGQIYTKEYTEWLENKVKTQLSAPSFLEAIKSEPITMQNKKIIQAIAATLEENLNNAHIGYEIDCQEIATEIAAAIAPHLEAGAVWDDAPEWAEWRTQDKHGAVLYWENEPVPDDENGFWVRQINDVDGDFEYGNHLPDWKNYKQRRTR